MKAELKQAILNARIQGYTEALAEINDPSKPTWKLLMYLIDLSTTIKTEEKE